MFNPMGFLPDDWKTDVVRVVDGGRDSNGRWIDGAEIIVIGCVIAPGVLTEDGRFSDITTSEIRLFAPLETDAYSDPEYAEWSSGDTVRTPESSIIAGTWQVSGKPVRWPGGWELRLEGQGGRSGGLPNG